MEDLFGQIGFCSVMFRQGWQLGAVSNWVEKHYGGKVAINTAVNTDAIGIGLVG